MNTFFCTFIIHRLLILHEDGVCWLPDAKSNGTFIMLVVVSVGPSPGRLPVYNRHYSAMSTAVSSLNRDRMVTNNH